MPRSPAFGSLPHGTGSVMPNTRKLLGWVYLWRVVIAVVVFMTAAVFFNTVSPSYIVALAIAAIFAIVVSGVSLWYTHLLGRTPGDTFLYLQALFDLALVTTIVHVTGGAESDFAALYTMVIAVSAVVMPVASSLLVTLVACIVFFTDIVWWHPVQMSATVWMQLVVFMAVAVATAWLASRVRAVGAQHEVLQEEVHRLRLEAGDILRNISAGVVSIDHQGRLLFANPGAEALLQIDGAEWVNRPVLEMLRMRSPELHSAMVAAQRSGDRIVRAEGRIALEERTFPIGLTTTAVAARGTVPATVTAIFSDISDQKRLEQLHLRTERLEAVAELSASLAHEIRNPLASIRSSVEQLARSGRNGDDERFLSQLVLRESDRLSRLLSEFLDFSRVQVTRCRLLDLGAVAQAAVDVVREHPDCAATAVIEVRRVPVQIEGDEDLLHRVVQNLVLNSVQAAGPGARVQVETRDAAEIELPRGANIESPVLLRVSDNGPGIPADLRDRLFHPFVTGRIGGTGLGLAIVHRAIQAHRGIVLVDSEIGRGTTFTVLFPARAASEVAA